MTQPAHANCRKAHPTATFRASGVEAPYRCVLVRGHIGAHEAVWGVTEAEPEGRKMQWHDGVFQ